MDRRAALALVRTPPLRPALSLPSLPSLPRPSRKAVSIVGALVCLLVLLYAAARESSLFAVRSVELAGAPPEVEADARKALADVHGTSLVALDADDVERRLARVPTIRSASVDRAFPNGLTIVVVPERPTAVYRDGTRAWLLGSDGRVLATVKPHERARLPRIRLADPARPGVGTTLTAGGAGTALRVLRALPSRFPVRVLYAEVVGGLAVLVVEGGLEIRLGEPTELRRKLESAAAVLRTLPPEEREALAYLDVTVPDRVVGGGNAEPES